MAVCHPSMHSIVTYMYNVVMWLLALLPFDRMQLLIIPTCYNFIMHALRFAPCITSYNRIYSAEIHAYIIEELTLISIYTGMLIHRQCLFQSCSGVKIPSKILRFPLKCMQRCVINFTSNTNFHPHIC